MEFEEFDIEFLAQKLAENPQSPLFARLADIYLGREQSAEAMMLLEEGIKLFPNYYAGYIVLGKAHLAFKEYSKSQSAFEKALELSPFNQTAAQLLISVPNKPDESTRTTEENYFKPPTAVKPEAEQQFSSPESVQETTQQIPFETPSVEELSFSQPLSSVAEPEFEQPIVQQQEYQPVSEELPISSEAFPSYDDYFAQNQSRINTQSPVSLDEFLNNVQPAEQTTVVVEDHSLDFMKESFDTSVPDTQRETHTDPEPVFASPEQAQLFAEMNAMNEESPIDMASPSTDIDSLAEKLQSAEKIVPQENYQPQNPVPQETKDEQAYETDAVTPTLAEIYAQQGEYRAAIQAYEILMFSQPAKGGEFQQRIRELQQLQMEKEGLI
ncbi:MAG: hypothetical protein WDA22_13420 [Bacteroidota bacterium]